MKVKKTNLCRCGNPRMRGQSNCKECHAAYMRDWRPANPMSDDQRRKDIARSKVGVYVRRGVIQKTPCPCCGSLDVRARILDYDDPIHHHEWLCAGAHAFAVRTGRLPLAARAA